MSIISEIKCARCDRTYSGLRSRCPYCGARRIGSGKYSEGGDSSKGKMIIGVLILAVLVVAAGVLLFTAPRPEEEYDPGPSASSSETPDLPDEKENTSMEGTGPSVPPSETPTDTPSPTPSTPTPRVTSVIITFAGTENKDFTESVGNSVPLKAKVEPVGVEHGEIIWTSSDTTIFEVVPDNTDGTSAKVTIISSVSGKWGTLTVSVDGVESTCIVRVR